jgi:hypothetical protein
MADYAMDVGWRALPGQAAARLGPTPGIAPHPRQRNAMPQSAARGFDRPGPRPVVTFHGIDARDPRGVGESAAATKISGPGVALADMVAWSVAVDHLRPHT